MAALGVRAEVYAPGDTDLAWTRLTPWRSVLAAALDQKQAKISSARVEGEEYNPSTELLALWIAERLGVPVERGVTPGPGITAVKLATEDGTICLDRPDGALATLAVPGQPDRHVALHRRATAELIAEELRRLDPDDTYAQAVRFGVDKLSRPASEAASASGSGEGASAPPPKKPAATGKKAAAAKPAS